MYLKMSIESVTKAPLEGFPAAADNHEGNDLSPEIPRSINELTHIDAVGLVDYFSKIGDPDKMKAEYSGLLRYLTDDDREIYFKDINSAESKKLLANALERKQNLENLQKENNQIPENVARITAEFPDVTVAEVGGKPLTSYLSPAERLVYSFEDDLANISSDQFLARKSLQAIAYNRGLQVQEKIAAEKVAEETMLNSRLEDVTNNNPIPNVSPEAVAVPAPAKSLLYKLSHPEEYSSKPVNNTKAFPREGAGVANDQSGQRPTAV
jgi:hypothetical protein